MNLIALLLDAAHRMASAEPAEHMDPQLVAERYVELRTAIDRLESQAARYLAAVDQGRGFSDGGYPSSTAFVKHRCRTTGGRAKRMVAEARALREMEITAKLLDSGELSLDQARVLIRAREAEPKAFPTAEPRLCDIAREIPWVATLSRAVAYWQQAVSEAPTGSSLHEQRYLFCSRTFEGMVKIDGLLTPESGEVLLTALDAATPPPSPGDGRTSAQRRADALEDLIRGRAVPQLVVHVSHDTLAAKIPQLSETRTGTVLTAQMVRQLACDSTLNRIVFGPDSEPLDVGRSTRVIPTAIRRAVAARDRHCVFPGCDRPEQWCDSHHIRHWADGGETSVANLALLCRHHHTITHEGFTVTGTPPNLQFDKPSRQPP